MCTRVNADGHDLRIIWRGLFVVLGVVHLEIMCINPKGLLSIFEGLKWQPPPKPRHCTAVPGFARLVIKLERVGAVCIRLWTHAESRPRECAWVSLHSYVVCIRL